MEWFKAGWKILCISLILLLTAGCTTTSDQTTCCQQCLISASQDPAAYDISIKACSQYELSESCNEYFEQNKVRVGECREVEKEAEKLKK